MNHGEFLYILSMINKNLPINEYTFIITRNNLRKKIICSKEFGRFFLLIGLIARFNSRTFLI